MIPSAASRPGSPLGLIILGGIKRIVAAAAIVVPVMALGHILIALAVVLLNRASQ